MTIVYRQESSFNLDEMLALYSASGINRPTDDSARMAVMLASSNLLITARQNGRLLGLARCLTDKAYVVYICDLLVDKAYQQQGIGKALLAAVLQATGPQVQQLLRSAPSAMQYYPQVGFTAIDNAFHIQRQY
ncbi:GNAT superfamily N-acetyltransferase [Rheinheimera pacifica]|uniref:GNAT family N-acetyltransferase n=1 Tax=Rheinheimera pacifica TaxID=173990 RepID=UPI002168F47B|nr:GNAT family N-acetyltransferase [Rheinheimera pacifica]MCS4308180.1 GNAT superfamily N-acetyltransferase [Rheinheimera pacifica]